MRLPLELDITLDDHVRTLQPLGQGICQKMIEHIRCSGLGEDLRFDFGDADFRLDKDPYSGGFSLEGKWKNKQQQLLGSIIFHADGSFFAEYDVIKDHPEKKQWFVEAVTAWGKEDDIKVELRMIAKV